MHSGKIAFVASRKLVAMLVTAVAGVMACSASAELVTVETWGYNRYGQLGNGIGDGSTDNYSNVPVPIYGLPGNVVVGSGDQHSLAAVNGALYAWGFNALGQLGDGTNNSTNLPEAISGLSSGVTAVSGGTYHSLAIVNGAAYGWGYNALGQVGEGANGPPVLEAVPVSGLSSGVTAIAAGGYHSLAIQNGGVYAWGYNGFGQLGDGTTNNEPAPIPVPGLSSGVTAIAAGLSQSLAIKGGALYTWGYNGAGTVGDGTTTDRYSPFAVPGFSSGVTAIASGTQTLVVKNGQVYAWGQNNDGQLGDGTTTDRHSPVLIDPAQLTNIKSVATAFASSYAIASDGSLWVWGDNSFGQLGLGTTTATYLTPQHLLPRTGFVFTSVTGNGEDFGSVGNFSHVTATLAPVATLSLTNTANNPSAGTLTGLLNVPAAEQSKGTITVAGLNPANNSPTLLLLDVEGTSSQLANVLAALSDGANVGGYTLTQVGPGFDPIPSWAGPGNWDFLVSFATSNPDFNYDFTQSGATLDRVAAVPEPASIGAIGLFATILCRRSHRERKSRSDRN